MKLHRYSHLLIQFGIGACALFYLFAILLYWRAPYASYPHRLLLLHRSFLEAGPALLASSVCSALLCDLWHIQETKRRG